MTALAFPKHPRVRDPKAWKQYGLQHPRCAVLSCRKPSAPLPHHIHSNGLGGPGDVVPENAIHLCVSHHTGPLGPHTIGHRRWYRQFKDALPPELAERVRVALKPLKNLEAE